jgi:hypothetical protein
MENQTAPIQRTVFSKVSYPKVVDTTFRELTADTTNTDQFRTVDYFFQLYDDLFYEIPPTGEAGSHEFLIKQSSDYIGVEGRSSDVDALIEEINELKRQLLEANQTIIESAGGTNE